MMLDWEKRYAGNKIVLDFRSYFIKQWINMQGFQRWFHRAVSGISTQGAAESVNRGVKDHWTLRELLALSEFFPMKKKMVRYWSRNPDRQVCFILAD